MQVILMQIRISADNQELDDNRTPEMLETKLFWTLHDEAGGGKGKCCPWDNLCSGHANDVILGVVRAGAGGQSNPRMDL
jgi:hypothetical protein